MYRVQSDENYDPENQNVGNLAGMLWYLHNEIVWHKNLQRSGTYFSTPKTRIERFRVKTRATQPLINAGMNFGVVNEFDLGKCTGPYACDNFAKYGYTVGCETWSDHKAAFPHAQWITQNHYPRAAWYSLPGPCPSRGLKEKSDACVKAEPGGACSELDEPTGTANCTYSYTKVGEILIDELEGIANPEFFISMRGQEYNKHLDRGVGLDFWNGKHNRWACQRRVNRALQLFQNKYPDQPDLPDPTCDFNKYQFYPDRSVR